MPINNIQYRAEIGLFNNSFQRVLFQLTPSLVIINHSSFCKTALETEKLVFQEFCPSLCHLLTFLTLFIMSPIIVLFWLTFSKSFNLHEYFIIFYLYIYIFFRFIFNLSHVTIACHKFFVKFLVRYYFFFQICIFIPFIRLALILSGDIEINPGPTITRNQYPGPAMRDQSLSLCHWNLNGIAANNYIKISLLEAYNAVHNFDIICISETFLDSDHPSDDQRLGLQGYAMIRSDHPSNTKRGGVCIYYKEHLPFVRRDDITNLDECILGEIKVKNSKCFVTCVYRSPNQTTDESNAFLSGLEQTWCNIALESPTCSFVLGDINAKCTNWWANGVNNLCGLELYTLSSLLGYSQLINEPTNFEPNKSPSCIDLLFASQPNLVVESGVHPSLSNTCHHQIIFAKISFKVFLPSPYEREIWHYNRAEVPLIQRSIKNFDWSRAFENLSINDQV